MQDQTDHGERWDREVVQGRKRGGQGRERGGQGGIQGRAGKLGLKLDGDREVKEGLLHPTLVQPLDQDHLARDPLPQLLVHL